MDIIQTLILAPLEKNQTHTFATSSCDFIDEFHKIEKELNSTFYAMYVLKNLVDYARKIRSDFHNSDMKVKCMKWFVKNLRKTIQDIAPFIDILQMDINYPKMLGALYEFSNNIEGLMYTSMQQESYIFNNTVSKMEINNSSEMFLCVDVNIKDSYVFTPQTTIMAVDCVEQKCSTFKLNEEAIKNINDTYRVSRGMELYREYMVSL